MKKNNLIVLFLIIFLDLVGVGILIPVLAPIFLDPSSGLIPIAWTESTRNIALGFLIGLYPLAQFFGAPILGTLSDRYGRKRLLLISLFGTALGYLLFAYGLLTHQLWLLFASRALDGFTGGNIGVANSAIADMSTPQNRARNFGLIGMAFGFGFMIGPFLGGRLADPALFSGFNAATPFWFAAGLSFFNLAVTALFFQESLKNSVIKRVHALIGFTHIGKAWRMHDLRVAFIVIFLHGLGFCFFTQFASVFLVQKFQMDAPSIGTFFGYVGIWIAACQGVLTRWVGKRMIPEKVLRFSLLGLSLSLFAITLPTQVWLLYAIQPVVAIFEGLSFPNSTAVVSRLASDADQGEAMGITQSLRALGQAIPPMIAGFLVSFSPNLPTLAAGGLILLAWAVFMISFRPKFT